MDKLYINQLTIYAYHGVLPEEQIIGGTFIVDLILYFDLSPCILHDDLRQTIDYETVCRKVQQTVLEEKSKLIERIAVKTAEMILKDFDKAKAVTVKLTKINPPVSQELKSVSIEIYREKSAQ